MATFPALAPARRSYRLRDTPRREAGRVRYRLGSVRVGAVLELAYEDLVQQQAQQLRDHYRGQMGGFASFRLSTAAWAGHSNQLDLVPGWQQWLWMDEPEEEQRAGGLVNIRCRLRSITAGVAS